MIFACFEG